MSEPSPLQHIALIMDGNGRWAKAKGLPRIAGHKKGIDAIGEAIEGALENNIPYLTFYAFSTENWKRPKTEVDAIMGYLKDYLKSKTDELHKKGIRLRIIGERHMLSNELVELIKKAEEKTKGNKKLNLTIALSYGSRPELINTIKTIAKRYKIGDITLDDIDESLISRNLYTHDLPDPDLLIRTSGEHRISNFLLWQIAYTELLFIETHWPDFTKETLKEAITYYQTRERRYGNIKES